MIITPRDEREVIVNKALVKVHPFFPQETGTTMSSPNQAKNGIHKDDTLAETKRADIGQGCCSIFRSEFLSCFDCRKSVFIAQDGNEVLDMPASFSSRGFVAIVLKPLLYAVCIGTLHLSIANDPRPFWLAYLTHWSLVISVAYALVSCFNTIVPVAQPVTSTSPVGFRLSLMWVLFQVAAHSELLITTLYWSLISERGSEDFNLNNLLIHGGVSLAVLVEGLVANRIPVRLRHFWFVCILYALYLVWTLFHSLLFDIGNPDISDEDLETNDDAIYSVLDWVDRPEETGIRAALILGAASPILFLVIWGLSMYDPLTCSCTGSNRRYIRSGQEECYRRMAEV